MFWILLLEKFVNSQNCFFYETCLFIFFTVRCTSFDMLLFTTDTNLYACTQYDQCLKLCLTKCLLLFFKFCLFVGVWNGGGQSVLSCHADISGLAWCENMHAEV